MGVAKRMLRVVLFLVLCLLIAPDRAEPPREQFIVGSTPIPAAPLMAEAIPSAERFEELAKTDPLACFRAAVARYHRDVKVGYTTVMRKHERINGRMYSPENVEVAHRNDPQSTFMKWISEPAGQADRVLFVEGANDNQMLCRPKSALARAVAGSAVAVDPYGRDARGGGRVAVPESGLLKAMEQIVHAWSKAKEEGRLHVEYQGIEEVKELDGRKCHMFRRTVEPPEAEGLKTVVVGLDVENWLQVVNILTDVNDKPIASYYFKNIKIADDFPQGTFEKSAVAK
jgi:Protein of unknown function (DUF1571)